MSQVNPTQFDRILWGTPMPVMVRSDSGLLQLRFKGSCSLAVTKPDVFSAKGLNADNLPGKVRNILTTKLADLLPTMKPVDLQAAIAGKRELVAEMLKSGLGTDFADLGLQVTDIVVEGIEKV